MDRQPKRAMIWNTLDRRRQGQSTRTWINEIISNGQKRTVEVKMGRQRQMKREDRSIEYFEQKKISCYIVPLFTSLRH